MSNSAFTPTVLTIPGTGTSSSGQGELNLDTNPVAATDTTGYTAGTSHTVTRSTSASPLDPLVTTCLDISSTAAVVNAAAAGVYYSIASVPSSLRNKKLKLEFYVTTPASSAGTWGVSVRRASGATRVSLTTDSSNETILPSGFTGKFTTYFDTDNTTDYTVHFYQKARTSANTLKVTQIVVGPGIQPQGAVVGEWQSYTGTPTGGGTATFTYINRQYRRVGDSVEITFGIGITANGSGASSLVIPLPSGLSVDFTKAPNETAIGRYSYYNGTAYVAGGSIRTVTGVTTGASLQKIGAAGLITGADLVSGQAWYMSFTVPASEWAGSGTVQVAQNDVEYVYNTSTSTTDDTTSFGYGPTGASIQAFAPAATASVSKRVQFQTPIQSGDKLELEVFDGNVWSPITQRLNGYYDIGGTNFYGTKVTPTSATQANVLFFSKVDVTNAWSSITSFKWRVRKSSAGAAVGFGIHQPGVSSGLVSASGLVGRTDGLAVAGGYVGENTPTVTSTGDIIFSSAAAQNLVQLPSLPAGVWLLYASVDSTNSANISASGFIASLTTTSGATGAYPSYNTVSLLATLANSGRLAGTIPPLYVNSATATGPYYVTGQMFNYVSGSYAARARIVAVRIA